MIVKAGEISKWQKLSQLNEELTMELVVEGCLKSFEKERESVFNGSRKKNIVEMRSIIFLILKSNGMSYRDIGIKFDLDHTSIMHIIKTIEHRLDYEEHLVHLLLKALLSVKFSALTIGEIK